MIVVDADSLTMGGHREGEATPPSGGALSPRRFADLEVWNGSMVPTGGSS
jgi:hypothetical protein